LSGAPHWPPCFFDLFNAETGLDPASEVPFLIDSLVSEVPRTPDWRVDEPGGPVIRLSVISYAKHAAQAAFVADGASGVIAFSGDPSGWLQIDVTMSGTHAFCAFFDRPYEEHHLWPAHTATEASDPPGRMGKKRNWLSLQAEAWPVLRPLANAGGWVNLMAMEYLTIHVRLLNRDNVWLPVRGVPVDFAFELIAPDEVAPDTELWEFPPGSHVRCEMRELDGRDVVVAVALA
jgi:hypothetical protein